MSISAYAGARERIAVRKLWLWVLCVGMALTISGGADARGGAARIITPNPISYIPISIKHINVRRLFSTRLIIDITI